MTDPRSSPPGFGNWRALERAALDEEPPEPCAVQLRRRDGLVRYPRGKSAMVLYLFAARGVASALRTVLADELDEPGARGQGPLLYRTATGPEAQAHLEQLFAGFVERFGAAPVLTEALAASNSNDDLATETGGGDA